MSPRKRWIQRCFPMLSATRAPSKTRQKHRLGSAFGEWFEPSQKRLGTPSKSAIGSFASGYFYINLPSTLTTVNQLTVNRARSVATAFKQKPTRGEN